MPFMIIRRKLFDVNKDIFQILEAQLTFRYFEWEKIECQTFCIPILSEFSLRHHYTLITSECKSLFIIEDMSTIGIKQERMRIFRN